MADVLVITDCTDSTTRARVKETLVREGHSVTIVPTSYYDSQLEEAWDACLVWVDSISKSHEVARVIREKKATHETRISIVVWQPTVLSIGSGISVVHEVSYFGTAIHNMISKEKEQQKIRTSLKS
jgi:hypothetical protein